ncbi:MAG: 5'-nucleotidase C-terminal domain-containing protein [Bacteroidetes bacterium]|nr:5'-nucleotidase C-terminal domain-containing protein [Bacteroidota bacterium]MBK9412778.1 5'-nucleotidase C-terminal domain-containing protein [Bacteroidota bacterium]MBL0032485.1 5'-nucleotidase C-terminal domain-containing protein [Bacteroidota bacterium]MBP6426968.1 5'-nucleotidase C-terminal domain-containing protein [Bacteroidia bacterium]MBP6658095.1 5'-nucleotidase C-terminal domain-containing protein [Bacteroidia bacterium]
MKSRLRILFFLTTALLSCKTSFQISKKESGQYKFSDSTNTEIDSSIYSEIAPYREKMQSAMNEVLAVSTTSLERGLPESKLGNFLSDACMSSAKEKNMQADFAVFNTGGLRRPLPSGNITRGDVFELMPFENTLVILSMNGGDVKKLVNFIATKGGAPVSGIQLRIQDSVATNVFINNVALDTTKIYRVLTSDYLANGGDAFPFVTDKNWDAVNLKVRDALIEYLISQTKAGKKINVDLDGRITYGR